MANTKIPVELSSTPGIVDGSNATAITIDSNEKIIIGDTASHVDDLLQIETPASGGGHGIQIRRNDSNTDQTIGRVLFGNNTDTDLATISAKTDGANDSGAIQFSTQATGGASAERMRINSSGNLGIGTTSPHTTMVVNGGTETQISLQSSNSGTGANQGSLLSIDNSNNLYLWNYENLATLFGTNNTERMRIDSSGNVAIGTTSVLSGNRLDVRGGNMMVGGFGGGTDYGLILTPDDGSGYFNIANITGGNLTFNNSATIGSTERMRIDSSGRVGISESSPNNALLHLNQVHPAASNGSSDYSAGTNLALWIENSASSGYPRIFNKSVSSTVSVVTNYENNKHAYWGEVSDTRTYYFRGSSSSGVNISGSLTKGSGSFKIDHPLESKKDTHDLVHSFVESPQANNIYKGVAVLENGTATINLDTASGMSEGTYILLNTNTSCFTSNESDWDAVKGSVSGNILTISCQNTSSTAKVSWMVIGERQDQHMIEANWTDENGKVIVEPLKDVNA